MTTETNRLLFPLAKKVSRDRAIVLAEYLSNLKEISIDESILTKAQEYVEDISNNHEFSLILFAKDDGELCLTFDDEKGAHLEPQLDILDQAELARLQNLLQKVLEANLQLTERRPIENHSFLPPRLIGKKIRNGPTLKYAKEKINKLTPRRIHQQRKAKSVIGTENKQNLQKELRLEAEDLNRRMDEVIANISNLRKEIKQTLDLRRERRGTVPQ